MKKIILISLLLITLISTFCSAFAFEPKVVKLIPYAKCEKYLIYNKLYTANISYAAYQENGKYYPAYCLNKEYPGVGDTGYNVNVNKQIENLKVWRAIINGYPYKTLEELGVETEEEAYVATRSAVYTMLYNDNPDLYEANISGAGDRTLSAYRKIIEAAINSDEEIIEDVDLKINVIEDEWKIDNINKSCVSKLYTVVSNVKNGNYKITLGGNVPDNAKIVDINNKEVNSFKLGDKFKVLLPISCLEKNDEIIINVSANLETNKVLFGETTIPNTQNYALTYEKFEEASASIDEKYFENITSLKILKKDSETEKSLEGVKFNLLDENQNIVLENIITDKNGEIVLEKLIPGKYFVKEIETLENYNINEKLIEVNLKLNEKYEITVYNNLKVVDKNPIEEIPAIKNEPVIKYSENKEIIKLPVTGF